MWEIVGDYGISLNKLEGNRTLEDLGINDYNFQTGLRDIGRRT
jgi:hypothetical protein